MLSNAWVFAAIIGANAFLLAFAIYLLTSDQKTGTITDDPGSLSASEATAIIEQRPETAIDKTPPVIVEDVSLKGATTASFTEKDEVSNGTKRSWAATIKSVSADNSLKPYDRSRKSNPDELKQDQRKYRRCPYHTVQLLAPFNGRQRPSESDYREVDCHDISAQGIAFYLDGVPSFDKVVMALNNAESERRYMAYSIVRTQTVEKEGIKKVLVGCRVISEMSNESDFNLHIESVELATVGE